ncbi:hypothetical protein LTR27_012025 [Elasticomyces elasticus]|nr:hypothetical protein LTR27_012025 [Elasticomyces elasticus]
MEQHGDSSRKRGPDDGTSGNEHYPKRRSTKGKGRATDPPDSSGTATCSTSPLPIAFDPLARAYFICHQCRLPRPHPHQQSNTMDDSCDYCATNTLGADSLKEIMYCLAGKHATPRIFFMSRNGAQLWECCRNHEPIPEVEPTASVNLSSDIESDPWLFTDSESHVPADGTDTADNDMGDNGPDDSADNSHTVSGQSTGEVVSVVPVLRQSFLGTGRTKVIIHGPSDIPCQQSVAVPLPYPTSPRQPTALPSNMVVGPPPVSAHKYSRRYEWFVFAKWRKELAKGIKVQDNHIGAIYAFVIHHEGEKCLKVGLAEHVSPRCARLPHETQVKLVAFAVAKRVREQCTDCKWSTPRTWYWWGIFEHDEHDEFFSNVTGELLGEVVNFNLDFLRMESFGDIPDVPNMHTAQLDPRLETLLFFQDARSVAEGHRWGDLIDLPALMATIARLTGVPGTSGVDSEDEFPGRNEPSTKWQLLAAVAGTQGLLIKYEHLSDDHEVRAEDPVSLPARKAKHKRTLVKASRRTQVRSKSFKLMSRTSARSTSQGDRAASLRFFRSCARETIADDASYVPSDRSPSPADTRHRATDDIPDEQEFNQLTKSLRTATPRTVEQDPTTPPARREPTSPLPQPSSSKYRAWMAPDEPVSLGTRSANTRKPLGSGSAEADFGDLQQILIPTLWLCKLLFAIPRATFAFPLETATISQARLRNIVEHFGDLYRAFGTKSVWGNNTEADFQDLRRQIVDIVDELWDNVKGVSGRINLFDAASPSIPRVSDFVQDFAHHLRVLDLDFPGSITERDEMVLTLDTNLTGFQAIVFITKEIVTGWQTTPTETNEQ